MKRRITDSNLFWNIAGMAKGIVISSIIFLIVIYYQQQTIHRLLEDALQREIQVAASLTLAESFKDALEANNKIMRENNRKMRKAIVNLGLSDHLYVEDNRLKLAVGGE